MTPPSAPVPAPARDDRVVLHAGDRILVYDLFLSRDGTEVCLLGNATAYDAAEPLRLEFEDGSSGLGVQTADAGGRYAVAEENLVLILHFPVPSALRGNRPVRVRLWHGSRLALGEVTLRPYLRPAKQRLAIVTMFKDDHRLLADWIDYHRAVGVEHFYLYDNNSADRAGVRAILAPYVAAGVVTHLVWDYPYRAGCRTNSWRVTQRGQMHHGLYKYGPENDWLVFADDDEYLYPPDPGIRSLVPLLEAYGRDPNVAALQVRCMWFGNSGYTQTPPGCLPAIYTWRVRAVEPDSQEKCIVRPEHTLLLNIHSVKQSRPGTRMVTLPGEILRLNHYRAAGYKKRVGYYDNLVRDQSIRRLLPADAVRQAAAGDWRRDLRVVTVNWLVLPWPRALAAVNQGVRAMIPGQLKSRIGSTLRRIPLYRRLMGALPGQ